VKTERIFKDPKSFAAAAERYFRSISYTEKMQEKNGEYLISADGRPIERTVWARPPTVSGLCLALGITESELSELAGTKKYGRAVSRAMLIIENYLESELYDGGQYSGVIAGLKIKFGWSEKKESEKELPQYINTAGLSLTERIAAAKSSNFKGGENEHE